MDEALCQLCGASLNEETQFCVDCGTHRVMPRRMYEKPRESILDLLISTLPPTRILVAAAALSLFGFFLARFAIAPRVAASVEAQATDDSSSQADERALADSALGLDTSASVTSPAVDRRASKHHHGLRSLRARVHGSHKSSGKIADLPDKPDQS